jgi:hypothetical protein
MSFGPALYINRVWMVVELANKEVGKKKEEKRKGVKKVREFIFCVHLSGIARSND